eukprot:4104054-Pyramimonas_sp.AAC.1
MYDGIRATSDIASLYFLFLVVIGNYIILNLFLAILLDNFGGGNDDDDDMSVADDRSDSGTNLGKVSILTTGGYEPPRVNTNHRGWIRTAAGGYQPPRVDTNRRG